MTSRSVDESGWEGPAKAGTTGMSKKTTPTIDDGAARATPGIDELVERLEMSTTGLRRIAGASKDAPGAHRLRLPSGEYETGTAVDILIELFDIVETIAGDTEKAAQALRTLSTEKGRLEGAARRLVGLLTGEDHQGDDAVWSAFQALEALTTPPQEAP